MLLKYKTKKTKRLRAAQSDASQPANVVTPFRVKTLELSSNKQDKFVKRTRFCLLLFSLCHLRCHLVSQVGNLWLNGGNVTCTRDHRTEFTSRF